MSGATWTHDPVWPWSVPDFGLPALAAVAALLTLLTVWSYRGVPGMTARRLLVVLGLRLAALALAFAALLRPALAFRDDLNAPSVLILVIDSSESMTIQDEMGQARWARALRALRDAEPLLQRLRDERDVNVVVYQFAGDVRDFDPQAKPDGKRTDFGEMLRTLYERHRAERHLRGLLVLSDGADNGTRFQPLAEVPAWRDLPCPVHTFALGSPTTSSKQRDVAILPASLTVEPSPVPVKAKMTVQATLDAPGFENAAVLFRLFLDDQEVPLEKVFVNDKDVTAEKHKLIPLTKDNRVRLQCSAPPKPGEVKLTLKVQSPDGEPSLPGETSAANNEAGTYVSVTKEGVSVLVVDKNRVWEPQFLIQALSQDPRFRVFPVWLRRNPQLTPAQLDLFQFDKQHYDVVILGDVRAARMPPQSLALIRQMVHDKGTGLLMMGGYDSFGPDWRGTELELLSPVTLDGKGQETKEVKMAPTADGLRHFVLQLADGAKGNKEVWDSLKTLNGMTLLGEPKRGLATVLARAGDPVAGPPLLVGQQYGSGRTLAFGGDSTERWRQVPEGIPHHARFWKQLVLWLAKQEEAEGNVWVKPDARRLAAGNKLGFRVGLRGKAGVELPDGKFEAKVVTPKGEELPVPTARDAQGEQGVFWKTDAAGEYKLVVNGNGKDGGDEVRGTASARFLVYQDEAEMTTQAANHDFLKALAARGGGQFRTADEFGKFLKELESQPLPTNKPKADLYPDWKRTSLSGFLLSVFLLFVELLSLEWFLRRRWGLV